MGSQGSTTVDFGATPGTNHVTKAVTGQGTIIAGSHVEAFIQGNDSTADHNVYEHSTLLPQYVSFSMSDVVAGTGFTINAFTELRLTGLVAVRWVWN